MGTVFMATFSRRAVALLVALLAWAALRHAHAAVAPTDVPAALALAPEEHPVLRLQGRGTQNYECREKHDASGENEWVLIAPEAVLLDARGREIGKHYGGPTWESTRDGGKIVAVVEARADAPDPDAIPWLLLSVKEPPTRGGFARVSSVQRTDTHGGKPPAASCRVGEMVKVPYSAVYWFSRPGR